MRVAQGGAGGARRAAAGTRELLARRVGAIPGPAGRGQGLEPGFLPPGAGAWAAPDCAEQRPGRSPHSERLALRPGLGDPRRPSGILRRPQLGVGVGGGTRRGGGGRRGASSGERVHSGVSQRPPRRARAGRGPGSRLPPSAPASPGAGTRRPTRLGAPRGPWALHSGAFGRSWVVGRRGARGGLGGSFSRPRPTPPRAPPAPPSLRPARSASSPPKAASRRRAEASGRRFHPSGRLTVPGAGCAFPFPHCREASAGGSGACASCPAAQRVRLGP